jgi:hypothetical protein
MSGIISMKYVLAGFLLSVALTGCESKAISRELRYIPPNKGDR